MYQFFTQITPATVWLVALPFSVLYWLFSRSGMNLVRFDCCKRCNDYAALDLDDSEIVSPPDGDETYFARLRCNDLTAWKN